MKQTKSIFASKTFWVNLIAGILSAVVYINPELLSALGLDESNQHKILTGIGALVAILNIVLRSLNGAPVSLTPKADNAVNNK
jgi:hypothetical protein